MPSTRCRLFVENLDDYILRALPPDTLDAFDRHLEHCLPCERYLREYWSIVRGLELLRVGAAASTSRGSLEGLARALVARAYS